MIDPGIPSSGLSCLSTWPGSLLSCVNGWAHVMPPLPDALQWAAVVYLSSYVVFAGLLLWVVWREALA